VEEPGPDASAAEIMEYMESDFWNSFSEGIEDVIEEKDEEMSDNE